MALAELTVIPQNSNELKNWSFSHQANHLDIIRRIYETTTPIPPATPGRTANHTMPARYSA